MNNKGFAITGILYTLFTLFVMILLSVLATISYKKTVLEKTITKLEDDYELQEVENLNDTLNDIIEINGEERTAKLNAKYEFITQYTINGQDKDLICSIYLKKGDIIPKEIIPATPQDNFILIPNDCNKLQSTINYDQPKAKGNLKLNKVYTFKEVE